MNKFVDQIMGAQANAYAQSSPDPYPSIAPFRTDDALTLSPGDMLAKTIEWYRSLALRARADAKFAEREASESAERATRLLAHANHLEALAGQLEGQ